MGGQRLAALGLEALHLVDAQAQREDALQLHRQTLGDGLGTVLLGLAQLRRGQRQAGQRGGQQRQHEAEPGDHGDAAAQAPAPRGRPPHQRLSHS
jgi:hypothetical protein